jgi:multidrug efflux pump subunit AcrA (membrane-fusion protein)
VATSSTRSTGGSGGAAGGGSSSATRVAADEVAILQDQDAVTQAQSDLEGATLKAPIAGTVGRIDLTVGQAASTSTGIVIVGAGAADVTVNVPLADMGLVHAGLATEVTPAGDVTAVPGTVSSVSLLPSSSTATTPTYPATIVVPAPPRSMASGSVASVAITVGQAADAVRVPVSALAGVQSGTGQVQVLTGSGTTTRAVTVGAVGSGFAQVMTGLAVGDRVVLADVNAALPSNQSNGLRGLGGGGFAGRGGGTGGAAVGGRPGG